MTSFSTLTNLRAATASAVLLLLLSACAHAPQYIRLDPPLHLTSTKVEQSRTVLLKITDSNVLPKLGENQTRIELEQPLNQVLRNIVRNALTDRGFVVIESGDADRQLVLNITQGGHVITKGLITDNIAISIALQFTVTTPAGTRTRAFNDNRNRDVGGNAKIGEVAGDLNLAFGDVLSKALNDAEILQALSK